MLIEMYKITTTAQKRKNDISQKDVNLKRALKKFHFCYIKFFVW